MAPPIGERGRAGGASTGRARTVKGSGPADRSRTARRRPRRGGHGPTRPPRWRSPTRRTDRCASPAPTRHRRSSARRLVRPTIDQVGGDRGDRRGELAVLVVLARRRARPCPASPPRPGEPRRRPPLPPARRGAGPRGRRETPGRVRVVGVVEDGRTRGGRARRAGGGRPRAARRAARRAPAGRRRSASADRDGAGQVDRLHARRARATSSTSSVALHEDGDPAAAVAAHHADVGRAVGRRAPHDPLARRLGVRRRARRAGGRRPGARRSAPSSRISAFASERSASSEPNRSRWTGPMAVMTDDVGRAPAAELGDLARPVGAHLGDEHLGAVGQVLVDRPGQPGPVVEAGGRGDHRPGRAETRWARWPLVDVFPYEPVMATTVGATRRSRCRGRVDEAGGQPSLDRRRWRGTPGRRGTGRRGRRRARAPTAGPLTIPTTTTTSSSSAHTAARVRSRRVQASGDVRPRTPRPSGPAATTAAVTTPTTGHHDATTAAPSATTAECGVPGREPPPARREPAHRTRPGSARAGPPATSADRPGRTQATHAPTVSQARPSSKRIRRPGRAGCPRPDRSR